MKNNGDARARARLWRRRASYSEVWWYHEVVVAADEEEAEGEGFAVQGEGKCVDGEFSHVVEDVEEISPDELDQDEARQVAAYLADGAEHIQKMSLQEVQEWLKRKLQAEDGRR
jgi:hypothetical protein